MKSLLIVAVLVAVAANAASVPTPAGERPSECVHRIPAGSHVYRNKDGSDDIVYPCGRKESKKACHEYGTLPMNKKKQQQQQQQAKKHSMAEQSVLQTTATGGAQAEAEAQFDGVVGYSGWTTFTKWFYPNGVGKFLGYWNVPKEPVNASYPNPLYTFTALQNIDWVPKGSGNASSSPSNEPDHRPFDIIQPVMEFYSGPASEGRGWSISSWIVSLNGGNTYNTEQINVKEGQEIFGNMTKTGDRSWFINTVRMTDGANTTLVLHHNADPDDRLNNQSWAYTAVECYACTGCSTYPTNPLTYYNMQMWDMSGKPISAAWEDKVEKDIHWCNESVATKNPSEVVYTFQF